MHSQSSQPCRRARFLSALKLSETPNKAQGISSSNLKRANAHKIAHLKPVVNPTPVSVEDQCDDPLLVALARSANTSTSNRYARQRSTKVPIRIPAGFPVNQNFSQRVIYTFENVKDESELEEHTTDEHDSLDQSDPLLVALARSANNSTSRRYTRQRSTKVPIRVPAGFPVNRNFSQRVIHTFGDVKGKMNVDVPSADENVILVSKRQARNQDHTRSKGIDAPKADVPEFRNNSDSVNLSLSTPVRAARKDKHRVSSTLVTPGLTISSSSATFSMASDVGSSSKTSTSTSSSGRVRFSIGSSLPTQKWLSERQAKKNIKRYTIHEALLSPVGVPSPGPMMTHRQKSHAEILAGLEFLNNFYAET